MKKRVGCIFILIGLIFCGCVTKTSTDTVYQISTIDALLAGVYDGELSLRELVTHGDFGIGTFDRLDGEMIVLDDSVYQVKADGHVYRPDLKMKTPFATVCRFMPERNMTLPAGLDVGQMHAYLDSLAPNPNLFYAFRIKGNFRRVKTRSVPGQHKPYPPLSEVTAHQPEFEMADISGTLIGFRCPPFVEGINVPGYHLHFLSSDKMRGGHVLEFDIRKARLEIDRLDRFVLQLPKETEDFAATDLSQDRTEELEDVEN